MILKKKEASKRKSEKICLHCKGKISIRNPSGYCDHLYYPENCGVCKEMPSTPDKFIKEILKRFDLLRKIIDA